MKEFPIRKYQPGDEYAIAEVVRRTLLESNSQDYPPEFIQENVASHSAGKADRVRMVVSSFGGRTPAVTIGRSGKTGKRCSLAERENAAKE